MWDYSLVSILQRYEKFLIYTTANFCQMTDNLAVTHDQARSTGRGTATWIAPKPIAARAGSEAPTNPVQLDATATLYLLLFQPLRARVYSENELSGLRWEKSGREVGEKGLVSTLPPPA